MTTSRLIVKNLPKSITEDKLREVFGKKGTVTDVQLKYAPDGKFRQFGFVGFKTGEEAEEAKSYLDKTYVGASKISVDICVNLGDKNKPKAWSKHATENSEEAKAARRKNKRKENDDDAVEDDEMTGDGKPKKMKKVEDIVLEKCEEDPNFAEFLEVHQKKSAWGNDTVLDEIKRKKAILAQEDEDREEKEDDSEENEEIEKDKESQTKKNLPDVQYFTIKLRNLLKKIRKKDLKNFFAPIIPKSIRFPKNSRGFAYLGFASEEDRKRAMRKNKEILMGQKVLMRIYESTDKIEETNKEKKTKWKNQQIGLEKESETIGESGRIFIRNLSYATNEEEIKILFEKFGPITEVHLPLDRKTRKLKGFGFVSFLLPEHALKAFNELDGSIFQGRMLHLLPSKNKEEVSEESNSFKQNRNLKLKKSAGKSHNWNTLFLGQDAVATVAAEKYGISKADFLLKDNEDERDQNSIAVRMALAETEIVNETKMFLEENGVCLEAFEGERIERSTICLLVKNLAASTSSNELHDIFTKHGEISRIILPPSGITAIVEFLEPAEARAAFKKLAYTNFKGIPLYLEWAPFNIFNKLGTSPRKSKKPSSNEPGQARGSEQEEETQNNDKEEVNEKESLREMVQRDAYEDFDRSTIPENDTTLFVKNLNFSTDEAKLKKHFEEDIGPVYSVIIARKKDSKNAGQVLSMGYGFVQFYRNSDATDALKKMQGSMIENHFLELKRSNRNLKSENQEKGEVSNTKKEEATNKMLIRNVAFQATQEELTQLFSPFGEIKAIRLPKKLDGSGNHRGFAFIEYFGLQDSKRAFETLSKSTHLYGRRLVLEWAAGDETVEELRIKTAQKYELQNEGAKAKLKRSSKQMMRNYEEKQSKSERGNNDDD